MAKRKKDTMEFRFYELPQGESALVLCAAITMPMLIANLAAGYTVDYGVLMMGVLFCSIPTMLVFFVLQKQFAEGITGSVK